MAASLRGPVDSVRVLRDRALLVHAAGWTALVLASIGIVTAVIPNPVFGRGIAPTPSTIATWLASAPLMGLLLATYTARPAGRVAAAPLPDTAGPMPLPAGDATQGRDGSMLGTLGGLAAFLAIGCPTCNKIVLLLLGASGAVSVFAPIQPLLGGASLVLLAGSLAWRLRLRARGGACPLP